MKSNNPIFNSTRFSDAYNSSVGSMDFSTSGVAVKAFALLAVLLSSAGLTWAIAAFGNYMFGAIMLIPSMIFATIAGLFVSFNPKYARGGSIVYSIFQGILLASISLIFNARYPGIVFLSLGLTLGLFAAMLLLYMFNIVSATDNFKIATYACTGGLAIFSIFALIMRLFGANLNLFYGSGLFAIGFSLFILAVAAMNLVLDFNFIEECQKRRAHKGLEWYCAFALIVNLIWIYVEMLKLLKKLGDRK